MQGPALNPLFQVGLNVYGRACLVIGGAAEAEDKTARLLDAGACVTLVSPDATPALRECEAQKQLVWRRRRYKSWDLKEVFLVMNTVRNAELGRRVFAAAEAAGAIINTYDDLEHSHFGMAALVSAGPLRVSISTSNASPTLAGRLRRDLEAIFDDEFEEFLEALGQVRAELRAREPDFSVRRQILRDLVQGAGLEGTFNLPDDWRQRVQDALHPGQMSSSSSSSSSS